MLDQRPAARSQKAQLLRVEVVLSLQHSRHRQQVAIESDGAHQVARIVQQPFLMLHLHAST
jgi:hypothetical protein